MIEDISYDVLVVDDHPMMRRGVMELLDLEDEISPVGEASNGKDAVELALSLEPDLILLDLNMPGMNGIETIKAMRSAGIDSRILIFTVSDDHRNVVDALKEGADGYLLKDMEPEDLVDNIKKAIDGRTAISPELTEALATAIRTRETTEKINTNSLTDREKQVLKLVANGLSNKMIARKLDIAEGTVKVHVKRVLNKLGMRSRVEAAVWVAEGKIK
ncbi:MAG: two-component system response regulator NarL [Pseudomonadales bacterium]|nr:two-component system response regulator NarL [Pseudomonadales bacterium]